MLGQVQIKKTSIECRFECC